LIHVAASKAGCHKDNQDDDPITLFEMHRLIVTVQVAVEKTRKYPYSIKKPGSRQKYNALMVE
jgi:hypothetical protein